MQTRSDVPTKLRQSHGFAVETATGRFGTVEGFRAGTHSGMPSFLVVRAGLLGRRRMMISVDDVSQVLLRQKCVRLRSNWMTIKA